MAVEETAEELAAERKNRRAAMRFGVDANAQLLLVKHGSTIPCRIADLSLGGCRLHTQERFAAGSMVRVEVSFKVRGLAFRFSAVTQWTDGRHLVGVRFMDVSTRRREELAEALAEVEAENAAKAAKQAAEAQAALEPAPTLEQTVALEQAAAPAAKLDEPEAPQPSSVQPAPVQPASVQPAQQAKPAKRERRIQSRQEIDTSAVIFLINVASRLTGRILDLSPGGCRIRTDESFPVGIYTRVEAEFRLEGLPFRLGGVIQAIHDKERRQIGIRFLDMSSRKREQLEQLIEEIRQLREEGIEIRE